MPTFSRRIARTVVAVSLLLLGRFAVAQQVTMTGNEIKQVKARAYAHLQTQVPELLLTQVASLSFTIPAGQSDDILVTFSSQCRLDSQGGPTMDLDYLQIFVVLDNLNTPLVPSGGIVYCSSNAPGTTVQASAFTFFKDNVSAGAHTVKVYATVTDINLDSEVSGAVGPWILRIDVAD